MSKFNQGNTKACKLNGVQVMEIREKYASGEYTQSRLSREYLVSISTIRNIVTGVSWQELPSVTPSHVVDEGALRSLRKLNEIMSGDGLPPGGQVDDETFAAMERAAKAVQQIPVFDKPNADRAARMAAYGVRPQGDGASVGVTEEFNSHVDEDDHTKSGAGDGREELPEDSQVPSDEAQGVS